MLKFIIMLVAGLMMVAACAPVGGESVPVEISTDSQLSNSSSKMDSDSQDFPTAVQPAPSTSSLSPPLPNLSPSLPSKSSLSPAPPAASPPGKSVATAPPPSKSAPVVEPSKNSVTPPTIPEPSISDVRKDSDNSPLPTPQTDKQSFVFQGSLKPTVYYQAFLKDDCDPHQRVNMLTSQNKLLMRVCKKTFAACALEGSCRISQNGAVRSFNVDGKKGANSFFEIREDECFFGIGVKSICLDPFYSVAADMKYFRPGDVIYVPVLVGQLMPNGEKHNGFLIVRDRGGAIKGSNRFDFFSGSVPCIDSKNPFSALKLSDPKLRFPFYRVRPELARRVLLKRAFPKIPPPR